MSSSSSTSAPQPGQAGRPGMPEAAGEHTLLLEREKGSRGNWLMRALGPGLFVCLADTDAGCLVVAAQSGAKWGYSLLLLQILLVPVLFMAQELTVRLGVYTRQGHTACIREHFGPRWAWFATGLLVFECIAAMMSEMSGVAAVAELWGLGRHAATLVATAIIVAIVVSCSYRQIEAIGVAMGLCELIFVVTMCAYHPPVKEVLHDAVHIYEESEWFKLVAANIGAVIMPWMIYFQQSAVVARKLTTKEDLRQERTDTLFGSLLTQLVMIGTLVTLAATHDKKRDLDTIEDIVLALEPALGGTFSKVAVSVGFTGGSLCAAFVVSLAATWAVVEAAGMDASASLDSPPSAAPWFYGVFLVIMGLGVGILLSGVNIVTLNIMVELLDGMLLPFAVGFLFCLATGEALPPEARVVGARKISLGVLFTLCTLVSLASAIYGLIGDVPK